MVTTAKRFSVSQKAIGSLACLSIAVLLPYLFHAVGVLTGTGNTLSTLLLPMYLPVLASAMLFGSAFGVATALLSPVVSFAVSGMPSVALLPYMLIELSVLAWVMGMDSIKNPVLRFVTAAVLSRLVKLGAVGIGCAVGFRGLEVVPCLTSFYMGIPGLILQLLAVIVISRKANEP